MKIKSFIILFVLLCVITSITFLVFRQEKPFPESSRMGEPLFDDLPLNNIIAVRIISHDKDQLQSVTLKKSESEWVVENLFNFPADFSSISELVGKLKDSKIGRHFESSPDSLSRLALHEPDQPDISDDEKATKVQIFGEDQTLLADVLLGKPRESTMGDDTHFVKLSGENIVYLVDQTFRFVGTQPRNWIKTDLLTILSDDIERIICKEPSGQSVIYSFKRPQRGAPPKFEPSVGDRPVKNRTVDLLFDSLSSLRILDIAGPLTEISDDITGFSSLPYLEFQLFDGMIYRVFPGKKADTDQGGHYLKIEVLHTTPEGNHKTPETTTQAADDTDQNSHDPGISQVEINPEEITIEAYNRNQQLSPWVYIISDWEHESMVTDPETFFDNGVNNQ